MANKIIEIITEPSKKYVGSVFNIKVKAVRYATYGELKTKTVSKIATYTVAQLKGE